MISPFSMLFGFVFIDPIFLVLLLLLPGIFLLRRRALGPRLTFSLGQFLPKEGQSVATWRRRLVFIPGLLKGFGILLLILALMRPASPRALNDKSSGIDLLLCVDVSSSMNTLDRKKENRRIDVASRSAIQFLKGRHRDRVGLIKFARYPDLVCPLTFDHRALSQRLGDLELVDEGGPEDATGIGTALAKGVEVLQRNEGGAKVILLLTDGAENVSSAASLQEIAPIHGAQLCEDLGIRVHIILTGSGSLQEDGTWKSVDTSQIELVAKKTGGRFFRAQDQAALHGVFSRIDELETKELAEEKYQMIDGFLPFLVAGFAFFVLGKIVSWSFLEVMP